SARASAQAAPPRPPRPPSAASSTTSSGHDPPPDTLDRLGPRLHRSRHGARARCRRAARLPGQSRAAVRPGEAGARRRAERGAPRRRQRGPRGRLPHRSGAAERPGPGCRRRRAAHAGARHVRDAGPRGLDDQDPPALGARTEVRRARARPLDARAGRRRDDQRERGRRRPRARRLLLDLRRADTRQRRAQPRLPRHRARRPRDRDQPLARPPARALRRPAAGHAHALGSLRAVRLPARSPSTDTSLAGLTDTMKTLNPTLRWIGPHVTVCNYFTYGWTFLADHLSEEDPTGNAERVQIKLAPLAQKN